jgi:hypothetical protein
MTGSEWQDFTHEQQLALLGDAQVLADPDQQLLLINFAEAVSESQQGVRWVPITQQDGSLVTDP